MWNQKYTKDQTDISNEDKNSYDSQKDSGFLSGTILNSGDINSDDENEYQPDPPTKQEPKILSLRQNPTDERENKAKVQENVVCDSGIDLEGGISELSLQDCDNDEPSIAAEPDSESNNNKEITCDSFWEMCYTQDDDGDTQLHLAIIQELEKESIFIINVSPHPILLNILNDAWETALHLAVITHQPKIVRSLILAGADPSIQNFQGNTALHLVCASGDLECAKALTEPLTQEERIALRGKNPPAIPQNLEQRNYTGSMCLHIAVMEGHINIVNHLLRIGADIEAREGLRGYTPLQLSIDYKKFDVTRFLLNDCKPNLETENYARLNAYEVALRVDKNFAKELVDKFNVDDDYYYCECDSDSYSDDENDTYLKAQASKISNIVNRSQVQVS